MTPAFYEFYCPVKMIVGDAALEHIPFECEILGVKKILIVTSPSILKNQLLAPLQQAFENTNIQIAHIFDGVPPDSSLQVVQQVADAYRQYQCDLILAIGGGSVIDTAKASNILVSEGGDDLLQYAGAHKLKRPLRPLFVIPTTAGTGSETTMVAVISDLQRQLKLAFASYYLLPNVAILDPRMTQSTPKHLTAMTAMDAMTHAVEAYTCLANNPLSDAYATAAIKLIQQHIITAIEQPQHSQARLALAQAATMAGIAFSNSMVGLVHALGHALGAVTGLPHGLCMNLFLPYVLEYNKDINQSKIAELLLPLAGETVYTNTPVEQRAERAIQTIFALRDQLFEKAELPRTLRETKRVEQSQFAEIVEKAIDDGSIIFNPKETTRQDLHAILQRAW